MSRGQTVAEKIISAHAGQVAYAGDVVIVQVDGVMATDATGPLALKAFHEMGGVRPWDARRVSLILDHAAPAPNERVGSLHRLLREFAAEHGCHFYDVGAGICHQLMVENGHVKPGNLFLGADSHTPTYGALNALAMGVGSTDLAATILTGKTWLKVPQTLKIILNGQLNRGVSAKDLILALCGLVGSDGARYMSVEFTGEAVAGMTLASRMVLANMVAEMGGKCASVDPTGLSLPYDWTPTLPDPNAEYVRVLEFDCNMLEPMVAIPHAPDMVKPLREVIGTPVHQAFIGSCTNARLEDLQAAADVLRGRKVATGVRLLIAPASNAVFKAALRDGTLETLTDAGAIFMTSGCGPCVGTHLGVPGDGETVISSTNRNFRGRMGNPNADVYLSSPAVVAASAVMGCIADPDEVHA
jgi:3-isopropylmalate/(R)-2-methylmalate dehydratase large subunit